MKSLAENRRRRSCRIRFHSFHRLLLFPSNHLRFSVSLLILLISLPLCLGSVSELNERTLNSGFLSQLGVLSRRDGWNSQNAQTMSQQQPQTPVHPQPTSIQYFYPQEILEANSGLELSFNLSRSSEPNPIEKPTKLLLRLNFNGCGTVQVQLKNPPHQNWTISPNLLASCSSSTKSWIDLDVTEVFPGNDLMLQFTLTFSPFIYLSRSREGEKYAYLVAQYEIAPTSRSKRLADDDPSTSTPQAQQERKGKGKGKGRKRPGKEKIGHHSRQPHRRLCQRVDLYVDFKELNWDDWILSPMGYNAFMCVGECPNPLPARLNATNHAIVQSLLNSLNPEIPGPCCVATETSALNILYKDFNNTIQIKKYDGMRVEACGCR
ncbi:unnamed protein product, partial [Mesorhabditis belari]|uniref:TGF-beta family profile domain-containing protein n=1 Tax=Mesorhabditis belari TaxID=2138241 RepID=A0AAF3J740_9BILA